MSTHQLSIESRRPAILSVAVLFVLATVMLLASVAGVGTQSGNRPASVLDPADGKLTDYAFRLQSVGGATIGSDPADGKLTDYAFRLQSVGGATIGSDPADGKLTDYAFRRHDTGR